MPAARKPSTPPLPPTTATPASLRPCAIIWLGVVVGEIAELQAELGDAVPGMDSDHHAVKAELGAVDHEHRFHPVADGCPGTCRDRATNAALAEVDQVGGEDAVRREQTQRCV